MDMYFLIIAAVVISVGLRLYQKKTNGVCKSEKRLEGKVAIVTGGTSGMGLEIAKDFAKRGAKVIIACPFKDEGSEALDMIAKETNIKVVFKLLNLGSFASIREFAADIIDNETRLDILVNNAGGVFYFNTKDGLYATMQINFFGHYLLTLLLIPLLKQTKESRIVNVASILHWMGYTNFKNLNDIHRFFHYGSSKLYMLYFTNVLRNKLQGNGIVVSCVDPGAVSTNIWNCVGGKLIPAFIKWFYSTFYKTAKEGAQNVIYAAVDESAVKNNGGYVKDCRFQRIHRMGLSDEDSELFWRKCLEIVNFEDCDI